MYTEQYYVTWTDADGITYLERMTISSQDESEFRAILREHHVSLVTNRSIQEMIDDPTIVKTFNY